MPKMRLLPRATTFALTDLITKVTNPDGAPAVDNMTIDELKSLLNGGVKVYRALLSQSGTDAPVATVLENSLGGTLVWTRASAGTYDGTLAGVFASRKVFMVLASTRMSFNGGNQTVNLENDDVVEIFTSDENGDAADGHLNAVIGDGIEILVYP